MVKEFKRYDEKLLDPNTGRFLQSNKFKKYIHKTVSGEHVEIDVGYERFLGPEMFFHPVRYNK